MERLFFGSVHCGWFSHRRLPNHEANRQSSSSFTWPICKPTGRNRLSHQVVGGEAWQRTTLKVPVDRRNSLRTLWPHLIFKTDRRHRS